MDNDMTYSLTVPNRNRFLRETDAKNRKKTNRIVLFLTVPNRNRFTRETDSKHRKRQTVTSSLSHRTAPYRRLREKGSGTAKTKCNVSLPPHSYRIVPCRFSREMGSGDTTRVVILMYRRIYANVIEAPL